MANASVTVELVVLTVLDDELVALMVPRHDPPFQGRLALPGGSLLDDEDLPEAAERLLWETSGLEWTRVHLEQLGTYGTPGRDPRLRAVTVAYLAVVAGEAADLPAPAVPADEDDHEAPPEPEWVPAGELLDDPDAFAFDHHRILTDGVERVRAGLETSPLATAFCPDEFTIGDLRRIYDAVWGTSLDPRNFHRKLSGTPDFVVETGRITSGEEGRPARLYRRGRGGILHPAMLRPG